MYQNGLFFQVMAMCAADWPTQKVDGVIFHARSFNGDDDGLFELASELIVTKVANDAVMINGSSG